MVHTKKPTMAEPSKSYDMFLAGAFERDSTNIIYMPELHRLHRSIGSLVEERYGKTIYVPSRDVKVATTTLNKDNNIWLQFTAAERNSGLILANMDHYHEANDLYIMLKVAMQQRGDIITFFRGRRNPIIDSIKKKCNVEELALKSEDDTVEKLCDVLDQRFTPISEYPFGEFAHLSA